MIERVKLVKYLDDLLNLKKFSNDYSNNGLQVEGSEKISKISFAVDACLESINGAVENQSQMLIVHHGLSWSAEPRRIVGIHAARFKNILANDLNLYAVHLPLDAHETLGNNAVIAQALDLENCKTFCQYCGSDIGIVGDFKEDISLKFLEEKLSDYFNDKIIINYHNKEQKVKRVGIVSGGGGCEAVDATKEANAEVLITGELTHQMYHWAKEQNIAILALGHYTSETTGVKALMAHLKEVFDIDCCFIDYPTGL